MANELELLRFVTVGSVDDGKSTLIGRLLHDTESIYVDQLSALQKASNRLLRDGVDLALVTDGLRAEREQGITIDVAYRHFSTPNRRFIIADTPGHVQYTRNMVTGASTANLVLLLVDARNGLTTQTKRHAFIASLLGIRHLVLAVNKMDLVGFSQNRFNELKGEFMAFSAKLGFSDIVAIPLSALGGDNVVTAGYNMPWYEGTTLLNHLETVYIGADRNLRDLRYDVQMVLRPNQDFRGYAGQVASGVIRVGDEVVALPSGKCSRVSAISTFDGPRDYAFCPQEVTLQLADELDISRGDMLVRPANRPPLARELEIMAVWLDERPMDPHKIYYIHHLSAQVRGEVAKIYYRVDPDTLHREQTTEFKLNDIGRLRLALFKELPCDPYEQNRATGHLILVDPDTNATVAAGMVIARQNDTERAAAAGANLMTGAVCLQHPKTFWLTGLSGAGKSTLAEAMATRLKEWNIAVKILDGDVLRQGICSGLGFSPEDRQENIRRVAHVAKLLNDSGVTVICAMISPAAAARRLARDIIGDDRFIEAYVNTPLEICRQRDPKGLYKKAYNGEIAEFTGVSAPYEAPEKPQVILDTTGHTVDELVEQLLLIV